MGIWAILLLMLVYLASVMLLNYEFTFEMNVDTAGSCFVVMCPILNTIVLIKCYRKRHAIKQLGKEIIETIKIV